MAEKEVIAWYTKGGKHIPIFADNESDYAEDKKNREIAENKRQADKLNRKSDSKVTEKTVTMLQDADPRFSKDVLDIAHKMHDEFSEAQELRRVFIGDRSEMGNALASMDGLGFLRIRSDALNNYDETQSTVKDCCDRGYLAGDGTFENTILAHELAHNLDHALTSVLSAHAPEIYDKPRTMTTEDVANRFSKAFDREIKVGDVVSDIPMADYNTKFFKIDGKSYCCNDVDGFRISDLIIPLAVENIQKNWKFLGFKQKPTESELISQLSGYVFRYYSKGDNEYNTEIFAESYSNNLCFGKNAHPLAQEVMRLTRQVYDSATAHPKNGVNDFYDKLLKL